MPRSYIIKQMYALVNDAIDDALGKNGSITQLDTTDLVSLGKQLANMELLDGFYGALANRIVKTIFYARVYSQRRRSVLRDEHEYGAFIQKVYFDAPELSANPEYGIPQAPVAPATEYTYRQSSPYDVQAVIEVSAEIFGGQGTFSLEYIRPVDQIRTAFINETEMLKLIDGMYVYADNKIKLAEEEVTDMAVNTAIAYDINAGLVRNLLEEYNDDLPEGVDSLTAAAAMKDADFLKYACMEIKQAIDYMGEMSVVFNAKGREVFSDDQHITIEMLSMFNAFSEVYLQSDTFHNEVLKYNFEPVPRWQRLSNSVRQSFEDVSSISIKNGSLEVAQTGIIAFIHDTEHVAAYFGHRRTWEQYNKRDDVYVHGDNIRKGYAVDGNMNGLVFVVADADTGRTKKKK